MAASEEDTAIERSRDKIVPVPYVVSVVHGDQTVLLNAQTGRYFSLNAVGGDVWAELCRGETRLAIVERLVNKYPVPVDRARADVDRLLDQLVAASLVEFR